MFLQVWATLVDAIGALNAKLLSGYFSNSHTVNWWGEITKMSPSIRSTNQFEAMVDHQLLSRLLFSNLIAHSSPTKHSIILVCKRSSPTFTKTNPMDLDSYVCHLMFKLVNIQTNQKKFWEKITVYKVINLHIEIKGYL